MEISGGGATSDSVFLRELKPPAPELRRSIEIDIKGVTRPHTGFDQMIHKRMHGASILYSQGPRVSVVASVAPFVTFRPDEVRQHFPVRPTRCALFRPSIEVSCISTDVDHGVNGGTPAERFATREVDPSISQTLFRFSREIPIVLGFEKLRKGNRHIDLRGVVRPSRFYQSHPNIRILAEPRRQDATC